MAKKRTKAQRAEAARLSWERRRKGLPPLSKRKGKAKAGKAKSVDKVLDNPIPPPVAVQYVQPPRIAYAVREGDDIFVCFGQDGSLNRERISEAGARKLLRELTAIVV